MSRISRQVRTQAGLTLIEILVVLGLVGVVVGTTSVLVITGIRAGRTSNDFLQTQAQVRAGLDQVTDEVRWAEAVTAASGTAVTVSVPQSTPFSTSSPYTVTFAYDAVSQTITRRENLDPAVPIAYLVVQRDGSTGVRFEYFNRVAASLGSTPDPADLSTVARIRIVVSATSNGMTRTMAGDATLRGKQD